MNKDRYMKLMETAGQKGMTRQEIAERHTSLTRRRLELEREEAAVLRELAELEVAMRIPQVEEDTKIPEMAPIREAAGRTGLSYDCLRKLCLQGKIAYIRAGSKYLINMGKLADFLNGGMEQAGDGRRRSDG